MSDTPILRALSAAVGVADTASDGELLRRFAEAEDRTAFELVVRRHAELVWGVCRGALPRDPHAAEDAFQATFLILARKATTVRDGSAAGWLFRVARNVAVRARGRAARQDMRPLPDSLATAGESPEEESARNEVVPVVAEEVDRLTATLRDPVVLCFFEGHTHAEAAERLGWPIGTVASRLARAKDVLRGRLTRRGVVLPAAGLVGMFSPMPASATPLVQPAVATAIGPADRAPPAVLSLTEGVLFAMRFEQLKTIVALSALLVVAAGLTAALTAAPSATVPAKGKPLKLTSAAGIAAVQVSVDDKKAVQDAEAKELKAMEGKWRIVKVEANGKEIPANAIHTSRWTVTGDKIEITDEFSEEATILKLVVSLAQNPKHFDTTMVKVGKNKKVINNQGAALKDQLVPGLYERDGDTLTVCMPSPDKLNDGRPKELKAGEGVTFAVLERVKDEKDELAALAGEWKGVSLSVSGREITAEQAAEAKWVFKDAEIVLASDSDPVEKASVKLDPAAVPPTIEITITEGPEGEKGNVLRGIYFRQDEKLFIAFRDPKSKKDDRPTELKAGDDVAYIVFEREPKK